MPITLYHCSPSPPSRGALLTCRVLGVDVNIKEIDLLKGEHLSEEYVKINPQHNVPFLDDDGFRLGESRAIAGYLAGQYGKDDSWYPKNPQLRAVVDQRLYFDCSTLWPSVRAIVFPAMFLNQRTVSKAQKDKVNESFAYLEKFLHGRKWVASDTPTIADLALYSSMASVLGMKWNLSNFQNVLAWLDECSKLPGAQENLDGGKLHGELILKGLDPGQI